MSASGFPTGETGAQLYADRVALYGLAVAGIAYGIHACTFATCGHFLLKRAPTRMTAFLLAYITALFITGSLMFASITKLAVLQFVDHRDYPGGPMQWYNEVGAFGSWTVLEDVAYFVAEILSDGLLLYRAWMIWDQNYLVVFFPFLVYLGIIGLGFPLMCIPTTWNNILVVEAWFGCAAALNIAVTALIVGRLIMLSFKARTALGRDHSQRYASVAAIVVESAAPYAAFNILYIATYATGSPISIISWPVLAQVMCIAPQMILLRVALGHALSRGGVPSSARFSTTITSDASSRRWAPTPGAHFVLGHGHGHATGADTALGDGAGVDVDVRAETVGADGEIVLQAMRFAPALAPAPAPRKMRSEGAMNAVVKPPAPPYETKEDEL